MRGKRMYAHDYCRVGFYMITMTTANRRPLFGTCRDNRVDLTPAGQVVQRKWREIGNYRPEVEPSTLQVMPDHLHGIIYVKAQMEKPLGNVLRGFASGVTSELRTMSGNTSLTVWEGGYHDHVIMEQETLRAHRNYIHDNPRRFCLKRANPDLFVRVNQLHHPRLPTAEAWAGFGNLFLIEKPELVAVQVSRRAAEADIEALKNEVTERTANGAVMVSPFISAGEKAIASMVMDQTCGNLILIRPEGFPPMYKPSGAYFDLCAQGRLLVLTAFPYTGRKQTLTRERCIQMNAWVAEICANNDATP